MGSSGKTDDLLCSLPILRFDHSVIWQQRLRESTSFMYGRLKLDGGDVFRHWNPGVWVSAGKWGTPWSFLFPYLSYHFSPTRHTITSNHHDGQSKAFAKEEQERLRGQAPSWNWQMDCDRGQRKKALKFQGNLGNIEVNQGGTLVTNSPNTFIWYFKICTICSSKEVREVGTESRIIPILQTRELMLRMIIGLFLDHRDIKYWSWDLNPWLPTLKPTSKDENQKECFLLDMRKFMLVRYNDMMS